MRHPTSWLIALVVLSLVLASCADVPYKQGYLAKGEGDNATSLEKVDTFAPTEDLKLVLEFNTHTQPATIALEWENPAGDQVERFDISVPADVETMVVDYKLAKAGVEYWMPGAWQVKVRLSERLIDTIHFNVEGEIPEQDSTSEDDEDDEFDIDNPSNPFGD